MIAQPLLRHTRQTPVTHPSSAAPNASSAQSESLAPWRSSLSRALHRNRSQPFARYFQLATVKPDLTPANRTVVFRGFMNNTNRLMTICDRRSQKTDQIHQNSNAEACWYFTKTREQFRLAGQLTLITADTIEPNFCKARQQLWQNISDNARTQFAWPQPKAPREPNDNADIFSPPPPDSTAPLDTFCLLLLVPHSVDYLSLRGDPQTRMLYTQQPKTSDSTESAPSSSWESLTVNP